MRLPCPSFLYRYLHAAHPPLHAAPTLPHTCLPHPPHTLAWGNVAVLCGRAGRRFCPVRDRLYAVAHAKRPAAEVGGGVTVGVETGKQADDDVDVFQ